MSVRKPQPGASRLGRFVRRWRFDRNPLRRGTDRIETALLAAGVAALLIGTPFAAVAAGAWAHGMARQTQLVQQASLRKVTAVVLTVATAAADSENLDWQAQARWTAPDDQVVTHEVSVPPGTAVGGKLQVWTDRTGDLATPPLLNSQVAAQAAFGVVLGVLGSAAVLILAWTLARWAINRRRMAAWEADWQVTGPRWTTRT